MSVLADKVSLDLEYSKKLLKLYENNSIIKDEGTISLCANNIRDYFFTLSSYTQETSELTKRDILKPIERTLSEQNEIGSKLEKEHKKLDKEYKEQINQLEKAKMKFLLACSNAEINTRDHELSKISLFPQNLEKIHLKCINSLKEAKEAEKMYLIQLTITNNLRGQYIEEHKRIFSHLEALDYCFADICKESFQKYIVYSNAHISNQTFDLDKLKKCLSFINIDADMQDFINKNKVELIYPPKHEYNEYEIKLKETINEGYYPPEISLKIINTINENFEIKKSSWNYEEESNKLKITFMIKKIFNDDEISNEERIFINNLLKETNYQYFFLNNLNTYRVKGQFNIKEKNFEILGEILKKILNSPKSNKSRKNSLNVENDNKSEDEINFLNADKDYFEACKYVIILSQTFKCNNISLQTKIENEVILQKTEFWENMIQCK